MKIEDARRLRPGDKVTAYNGSYTQHARVVSVRPRDQGGLWITYEWLRRGKQYTAEKRHVSVDLPEGG